MEAQEEVSLPLFLKPLFWEYKWEDISWQAYRDFIISRILISGTWQDIQWLLNTYGKKALRQWLLAQKTSKLEPRQIRFWQLMLDLPAKRVEHWLQNHQQKNWR